MPPPKKQKNTRPAPSIGESVDALVERTPDVDFKVDPDDFILYELNRLIEEDRASFEDEEFRILIDEGIRQHVEENLSIRSMLVWNVRTAVLGVNPGMAASAQNVAKRVIRALENTDSDLQNVAFVVRKYTAYLIERLQSVENTLPGEAEARELIESWKNGAVSQEKVISGLQRIGRASLGPTADLILNSPQDRTYAETALPVLSQVRSSVSARVLAYVVSEPMLDEDLEARAYSALLAQWPLARPYIIHSLHSHSHEDLPFRWFQLVLEVDEVTSSELVYEELRTHGHATNYHEDLWALTGLLVHSHDPEIEDKVLAWINSPQTPPSVIPMLQEFLKEYRRPHPNSDFPNPWAERARMRNLNEKYIAASQLFDAGRTDESRAALEQILSEDSSYPYAQMLISFLR